MTFQTFNVVDALAIDIDLNGCSGGFDPIYSDAFSLLPVRDNFLRIYSRGEHYHQRAVRVMYVVIAERHHQILHRHPAPSLYHHHRYSLSVHPVTAVLRERHAQLFSVITAERKAV
ncbi:hypothetical protein [Erwinia pyrifoliae]|uniref:hypothetical protein n=1 Tax=Erwinia pyrifoliae TaxID=79967 RepID=UPI0035CCE844